MKIRLSASMLAASVVDLKGDIQQLNEACVDFMHIDIMDGHFVPNLTIGPLYVDRVRQLSKAPCDVHLMVENPERFINMFNMQAGERMCFHIEAANHPHRLVQEIKKMGIEAGIAINPGTPLCMIEELLPDIDFVHVLSVNPGVKGQPMVPQTLNKIYRLRKMIDDKGLNVDIEVDGSVQMDNIIQIVEAGATTLVLGPYTCFNKELGGIKPTLAKVKNLLATHFKSN